MLEDFGIKQELLELFKHLLGKGLMPSEATVLTRNLFNILKEGGEFTLKSVNKELKEKGWSSVEVDDKAIEIVLDILKKEYDYTTKTHTIH